MPCCFSHCSILLSHKKCTKVPIGRSQRLTGQMTECEHMRACGGNRISQSPCHSRLDTELIPCTGIFPLGHYYIMSRGSVRLHLEVAQNPAIKRPQCLRLKALYTFCRDQSKILISTNSPKPLAASKFPGIGDLPGYDCDFHLGGVWTSGSGLEYQVLECDAGKLWAPSLVG